MTAAETRAAWALGGLGAIGFAVFWVPHVVNGALLGDFFVYRRAADIGLHQGWAYIYDIDLERALFTAAAVPGSVFLIFWNPPPLAWLALPFDLIPVWPAYWLWVILLALGWLVTWRLLAPGEGAEKGAHLVLLLACFPVVFGLYLGQPIAWQAAALAGGWWLLHRERDLAAGIVMAAVVVKPQTLLLLPLFLLVGGRPKAALGWVLGAGALAALSLISLGSHGVEGALANLRLAADSTNPDYILYGVFGVGWMLWAARLAMIAAALGVTWRWRRTGPEVPMAAAIFISLATSQYLHLQDLGLVVAGCWLVLRVDASWQQRCFQLVIYLATIAAMGTGRPLLIAEAMWLLAMLAGPRLDSRRRALAAA